ncbi:hypothetical protein EG329_010165 [Mollisiaceae sp. DMI_Dod_QoI]|nr:hypothetical protein EG329_010165 [Helotiales sp. DMI_Dod_QoI]
MTTWWEQRVEEVAKGERKIIIQMATTSNSKPTDTNASTNTKLGEEWREEVIAGVVMLEMPFAETGPFRGVVQKLLVLPEFRGMGVARKLMVKLEEVAVQEGRGLLLLDTEKGSPAEIVYPRLGYIKVGEIPRYEISPLDGSLKDGVFFYKDMR